MNEIAADGKERRTVPMPVALLVIGLTITGVAIWAVAGPMLGSERGHAIYASENRARGILRAISMEQEVFCGAVIVDEDGDGHGEFGWLAEIVKTAGEADSVSSLGALARLRDAERIGGVLLHRGYCYVAYLPDGEGGWIRESGQPRSPETTSADAREGDFRVYAWPAGDDTPGVRAFAVDASGSVRASRPGDARAHRGAQDVPAAGIAFDPSSPWPVQD